ncbi:MAG: DUF2283 domain-containing protein [Limisphaerales bacterium]
MAELTVYHDTVGRTLTVWFDRPEAEHVCEETGDEIILMKDRSGKVIGFEKLNYLGPRPEPVNLRFETSPQPSEPGVR